MFPGPTPRHVVSRGFAYFSVMLLFLWGTISEAQQHVAARSGVSGDPAPSPGLAVDDNRFKAPRTTPRSTLGVTFASAAVPGAGQLLLRQRRGVAYLLFEAAGLAYYVSQSSDGRRQRDLYKDISRRVARSAFMPNGPVGDWDYYERMEKFGSSGRFDVVPGDAVDPEYDEQTYNGAVWALARQTFWRDPETPPATGSTEYGLAIAFYSDRAVRPEMAWSWAGEPEAYQQFRGAISGSNSAFRSATTSASVIIANHFLSAIDAYVSAHLEARQHADGSVSVRGSIPFGY